MKRVILYLDGSPNDRDSLQNALQFHRKFGGRLDVAFLRLPEAKVGSLACRFADEADVLNPACVKVVLDGKGDALYFSRSVIPYPRDDGGQDFVLQCPHLPADPGISP